MNRALREPGALLVVAILVGCTQSREQATPGTAAAEESSPSGELAMSDSLERAQARVTRKVIDLEGVTGTAMGLCNGKPCIKVYLESDSSTLRSRLPRSESGFPVVAEVTGKIRRP